MLASYYGQQVEVSNLPGWRGALVRVYVRLIAWLQRKVEWHLFHLVAAQQGMSKQAVSTMEEVFNSEDDVDAAKRIVRSLLKPAGDAPPTRADRYRGQTPHSLASLAAYTAPGRSKLYARKRGAKIADRDGDVLYPVPEAKWRPEDDG